MVVAILTLGGCSPAKQGIEPSKPTTAPAQIAPTVLTPDPKDEKPLEIVNAKNPYIEFMNDESAASAKFKSKGLEAYGTVYSVKKADDGKGYVVFIPGYSVPVKDDARGYFCRFKDDTHLDILKAQSSRAKIQGKFRSWDGKRQQLLLDDCTLREVFELANVEGGLKSVWKADK